MCNTKINKIEISFELPVELTDSDMRILDKLCGRICDRSCPPGWAFWPAGCGSKPNFSQADQRFLGKEVDQNAPESGEPTWDDSVYAIDCAARMLSDEEIERNRVRAEVAEERASRWDSRLVGWLHRRGLARFSWWIADLSMWTRRGR